MGSTVQQARSAVGFNAVQGAGDLTDGDVALPRRCRQRAQFSHAVEQKQVIQPQVIQVLHVSNYALFCKFCKTKSLL